MVNHRRKVTSHVELRPLASLRPSPHNAEIFDDLSDVRLKALVDDIAAHGLNQPIEILPDGEIVCGHQRVRACKALGWVEVRCRVLYALAVAGDEAVRRHLVADNLMRRQLSPFAEAKAMWEMKRAETEYPGKPSALAPELATRLGVSVRNARRYLNVLETPWQVQDAYQRGLLTLNLAERVAGLPRTAMSQVAQLIEDGTAPKEAVAILLRTGPHPLTEAAASPPRTQVSQLVGAVAALAERLRDNEVLSGGDIKRLRQAFCDVDSLIRGQPDGHH